MNPKKILAPIDFSAASRASLTEALALAAHFNAAVLALHVEEPLTALEHESTICPPGGTPMRLVDYLRESSEKELRAFIEGMRVPPGVQLDVRFERGDAAEVVLKAAAGADLVVMGSHGRRNWLGRALLGSVAETLVRESPVPVLTVRARE